MPNRQLLQHALPDPSLEGRAIADSLFATPARIAPKYLYDERGCSLYGEICLLPEYYLTRAEAAIFATHEAAIADAARRVRQFVDLGAGDCRKARPWIARLGVSRYVAVDLAGAQLDRALAALADEFPGVEMVGVVTDFGSGLDLDGGIAPLPTLYFYPGSSIGNFDPADALAFLTSVHRASTRNAGSGLLIGVDLKKDPDRLRAAYDDAGGITAAFNRNILNHVNALTGSDFDPEAFVHRGRYDAGAGRVEMHLEAIRPLRVRIGTRTRDFAAGERIHTENSYKYSITEFAALLERAGFTRQRLWTDRDRDFAVFYADP